MTVTRSKTDSGRRPTRLESALSKPGALREVLLLLHRLDAMGVRKWEPDVDVYDQLATATQALGRLRIGTDLATAIRNPHVGVAFEREFRRLNDELEGNPSPSTEWAAVRRVLGDLLPGLVDVSPTSVRRYESGVRTTPDDVAARLHVLALCNADLAGSYNEWGVRRWYQRPRAALGGVAPRDVLSGDWDPDDTGPRAVRELARALTGAGAA